MSAKPDKGGPEIRVKRRTYTVVWDDLFVPGQSARSWGIFCHLMSRPPNWVARADHLQTVFKEGRDAIAAAMQECAELGQLTKETYFEGNLRRQRYVLDEDALNDNPRVRSRRSARETDSQGPETPGPEDAEPETPGPEDPAVVSTEGVTTEGTTMEGVTGAAAGASAGDDDLDADSQDDAKVINFPAKVTHEQRAEHFLRDWWDRRLAERGPAAMPSQSYIAVKKIVTEALKTRPDALVGAGLTLLAAEQRSISGGSLQNAMREAAQHPSAPPEFKPYAGESGTGPGASQRPANARQAGNAAGVMARIRSQVKRVEV